MSAVADIVGGGLALLCALLAVVTVRALCGLVGDEARGWLEQLPKVLIRLACRRFPRQIPKEVRDDLADDWSEVLDTAVRDTQGRPITRLCYGVRVALGFLRAAPTVGRELNAAESVRQLLVAFPRDPLDPADWVICAPFHHRANVLLGWTREQRIDIPERADLLIATARFLLRTKIDPKTALSLHLEALGVRKRLFRCGHLGHAELVDGYHNVAYNLRELKEFRRACILDRYALRIRRSLHVPGDDDLAEHLARSLNSLASDLRGCGDAAQARPLDEEALEIRRGLRRRGHLPDDRDVARSLNNLADDLRMLGDLEMARQFAEEGFAMRKSLFGGDHPDLVLSLDTLAAIHRGLGNDTHAKQCEAHALAMRQRLQARWR